MSAARPLLVAGLLALSGQAAAQDASSKVRLDDFAVPNAPSATQVEQLGGSHRSAQLDSGATIDRGLEVQALPTRHAPVAQLSSADDRQPAAQLGTASNSRDVAPAAISSRGESRPEAAARLAGNDRCDPQGASASAAECADILELRAAEFAAAEPPRPSPEQVLLAERGQSREALAEGSSEARVRLASSDPNADARSNQEIAALYLYRDASPAEVFSGEHPLDTAELAEALQSLQSLQTNAPAPAAP